MTCVWIRGGSGDLHAVGDRTCGADERGRFLDVPAFGDERGAKAHLLAAARLVHQRRRAFTAGPGEQVVPQFIEHALTHCHAASSIRAMMRRAMSCKALRSVSPSVSMTSSRTVSTWPGAAAIRCS